MLSFSRTFITRAVSKTSQKSVTSQCARVGARSSRSFASRAVSGSKQNALSKIYTAKYSTNPYLKISKTESGPLDSMDMIAQVPPIAVHGKTAACDGGDGPLGHPKVYISLHLSTIEDAACCEYCGLRFISTDYLEKELKSGKHYERGTHFLEPADLPDWEYNAADLGGHH